MLEGPIETPKTPTMIQSWTMEVIVAHVAPSDTPIIISKLSFPTKSIQTYYVQK